MHLLHLARSPVRLATQLLGGGARVLEEAGEQRLEEGAEDDLSTAAMALISTRCSGSAYLVGVSLPSLRKGHPDDEDELEGVVEGEPVDGVDGGLNHGEEGVDDPVLPVTSAQLLAQAIFLSGGVLRTVSHCVSSALPLLKRASSE